MAHKRTRWIVVAVAVATSVLGAELALRLLGLPRDSAIDFLDFPNEEYARTVEADEELFWRLKPGRGIFFGNELGFRGYLPPKSKRPTDIRIVCVGDSCTFGAGVRYEETFGVQVERALQRLNPHRRVDVLLGAIFGHSTHQNRILYERRLLAYAPDVTVFYCGLYNDWTPAIGRTDAERTHQLRILQIVRDAFETRQAREAALELFKTGQRPDPPRVSLSEFRDNLESMIESATDAGSEVVVILPPRAESLETGWPFGLEYVDVARSVSGRFGTHLIDAPSLFRAYESRADDWREPAEYWPAFIDDGHPSILGHRLIAQSLTGLLSREFQPLAQTGAEIPRTATVDRYSVDALSGGTLSVRGVDVGSADRAWLGDVWLPDVEVVDDNRLRIDLPFYLIPGEFELELRTDRGLVRAEQPIRVQAPALNISITRTSENRAVIAASGLAPEGWHAFVWFAAERLTPPESTRYGQFELDLPSGRPKELPDAPFRFERLLNPSTAEAAADGAWSIELELDVLESWPDSVWSQALLVRSSSPWMGLVTQVVTADVR